jgi:phage shock protein PspC (stress-responsive transcriptional regulator)
MIKTMNDTPSEEERVDTTSQQTAGSPPAPTRPRLVRSKRDRKIAGVAGGIAEHLNIDPLLVRIGFVVSVFAGGLGFVLYLAGWLLIPEEGGRESIGAPVVARLRRAPWIAVVLFVIGGTILFSQQLFAGDGGAIFWALVLIGVGWLIYQDEPIFGRRREGPPPPPSAETTSSVTTATAQTYPAGATTRTETLPYQEPVETAPRPPRSLLGRYTFGALLLVIGLAALLVNAGVFTLDAVQYPALALTVVGAGLLVGTFWGRSRALIVLGLLLIPLVWVAGLVSVPLEGGFAERFYAPTTPALVEDEYRLVGGQMNFDLTDVEWGSEPVELEASVAFGEIEIAVPDDVEVQFHGSVAGGEIQFFDDRRSGYDIEYNSVTDVGEGNAGTLIVDASASFGRIEISDSPVELNR